MLNELFSDFIDAAEDDLRVMEESRYFGLNPLIQPVFTHSSMLKR